MKKNICIYSIIMLVLLQTVSQSQQSNLSDLNLKGNVKSITDTFPDGIISVFTFNDKGKMMQENAYYDNKIVGVLPYKYDDKGNLIEGPQRKLGGIYFKYDLKKGSFIQYSTSYRFNNKGKLIFEPALGYDGKFSYKYDEKNNVIQLSANNFYTYTGFDYDSAGHLTEEKLYMRGFKGHDLESTTTYTYDSSWRLIEQVTIRKFMKKKLETVEYKYNEKGNLIEKKSEGFNIGGQYIQKFDDSGRVYEVQSTDRWIWTYKYDDNGNLIEVKAANGRGIPQDEVTKTYRYTYDEKSNWIQKVESRGGIERITINRKIEYF